MSLSIEQLREMLLASLPEGPLWPRAADSHWGVFFEAVAPEFVTIDQLNEQLIDEMSPVTASLFFDEWEQELGLYNQGSLTLNERRSAMVERYTFLGRQDKQFFIDLAARLGFVITIDEFTADNPGPAGNLPVVRPSGETFHVSPSGDEWNYVWRVNAPLTTYKQRQFPSSFGEPFSSFGNDILETIFLQYAHEHRVLIFAYV